MALPDFINALPGVALPISEDKVSARAIRSDRGLAVFFTIHEDLELPLHSHGDQWGTVLQGEMTLTIGGETKVYRPGDSYFIPAGVEHGAKLPAGAVILDVFAEADRYPLRD
jgi:quercetin dioxygenase-like cupin family protein